MNCPNCKAEADYMGNPIQKGKQPRPMVSWYICLDCGSISRFVGMAGNLSLRSATADEMADRPAGERSLTSAIRAMAISNCRVRR